MIKLSLQLENLETRAAQLLADLNLAHGWLSKLWPLFGYPKFLVPYYKKDRKGTLIFDNHPHRKLLNLN